ncbi:hypothetical protein [Longimicrobium sp.]|uniref:hypothetical protein n=1 Tax=Longimicrobium sp. TaxID=2029185 RepID=UPI003B3A1F05
MAFTLRITFSGLCLFVPEPATPGGTTGRMHVLMPGMFGHHHHGADRHVPVLAYDTGHLVQGAAAMGVSALAKLTGHELVIADGDGANLHLCDHIVDLRGVTGRGVDPDHLGPDTKRKLVSRVTLGAGEITGVSPGVCWEWRPGEFRPIAHRVQWDIPDVQGDSLILETAPIGGGGASRALGTLFPVDGRVNLEVFHETPQDLPPDPMPMDHQPAPMPGDHPKHFSAFYGVFGGPVPMVLPRYWGTLADCPPLADPCAILPPQMGGTPLTCLVAGVGPG